MKKLFLLLLLSAGVCHSYSQDTNPLVLTDDAKYYNFWEGTWSRVNIETGVVDSNARCFTVSKGVHPACWKEEWSCIKATALRSWDKTNNRWMYVWVSENGLFQVWEGRKIGKDWYIFKEFDINGDKYLSRQGVIPIDKNRIMRISEKSYDNGLTWELRFKEYFQRIQ
ncbi:MAG TPA: hypothetical protein VF476_04875 [Chitinophagaceae bacterium]